MPTAILSATKLDEITSNLKIIFTDLDEIKIKVKKNEVDQTVLAANQAAILRQQEILDALVKGLMWTKDNLHDMLVSVKKS